jgi:hypothetical protein
MGKRILLLTVIGVFLAAGWGWADNTVAITPVATVVATTPSTTPDLGILSNLPAAKTGFAWDICHKSNTLMSLSSVDVVSWGKGWHGLTEDKVSLGAGFLTNFGDTNVPALTLNYKIGGLDKLGFSYGLANIVNIDVGAFAGKAFDGTGKWAAGLQASVIKVKF